MASSFSKTVTIVNQLGLHARAATKLAQLCQQFDAAIELQQEGRTADASSVLALLMLASSKGKTVEVVTHGNQAEAALQSVVLLIESGFDEE
ncbi:HPr family phosphocarrier protein [Rheinheimera riviphila]|uniref:HPr family phosphocarrier protein n=1 Tax=Rheinheimera riviphila TaxID=1834037 RepID=A0A437R5A1_9GAMM|nr:HPr family phosphocarrier protein [Rheinheimera riviphila]RVU41891.1 HPr family phosphocarrier protein [Rheinheimera riviphila]